MPTSRNGARAPTTTFLKHGETGRARRGGPCTAMPGTRTQTVGMACVVEESKHEGKRPSAGRLLQTQSWGRMHFIMRLCVSILNGSLYKSPVQDSQIQDWSKTTAFLGYNEVRAVKPLLHLGWRDRHPLPGGQQSPRARQECSGLPPKS